MTRRTWLEEAMAARGVSREALAAFLRVTVGAVSHWINGRTAPGGPTRRLLAFYLEIPEDVVARGFADAVSEPGNDETTAIEGAA